MFRRIPHSVSAGFHPVGCSQAALLRRTGCLSRILLLGTCHGGRVGPVIDAATDAEVMLGLIVEAVVVVLAVVAIALTQAVVALFIDD